MAMLGVHSLQTLSKITFGSIAIDKKKSESVLGRMGRDRGEQGRGRAG